MNDRLVGPRIKIKDRRREDKNGESSPRVWNPKFNGNKTSHINFIRTLEVQSIILKGSIGFFVRFEMLRSPFFFFVPKGA